MRRVVVGLLALAALAAGPSAAQALPPVKHVWIIQLENKSYDQSFVQNVANQYLWRTLPQSGALLTEYHGTGHASLDNYISQISGQAPNALTQADCPNYVDVSPGIMGTDRQAVGQGCVYPAKVQTLVDQLEAKGLTWKGYMEDLGNSPSREPARCGNPAMGKADPTQVATADDQYAARHNPFVYFHSILDPAGRCAAHVGPLPPLADDLQSVATTPNFSWITPNLCNDGHDATPCAGVNAKGTKEGDLIAADAFLAKWVPAIMSSPAFKADGLLLITFDESTLSDASACCAEPAGLNTPLPGITGGGGGKTGAVAVSPFIAPGTRSAAPYNHYSLLRTLEDLYGIPEHLGYAAMAGLRSFGDDVFTQPAGGAVTMPGPMKPGDAGSTGSATPLRLRLTLTRHARTRTLRARGVRVRLRVTGTDRRTTPIRIRLLRRGRAVLTRTVRPTTTALRLRVRRRLPRGRYVLRADAIHEGASVAHARASLTLR